MTKSFLPRVFMALIAVLCLAASSFAASDYYLEIEGIPGESRTPPGAIEVFSYSHNFSFESRGNKRGTGRPASGKVSMQDFHFIKRIDKSSPKLMLACAQGQHIPQAILSCRKTGGDGTPYLIVTMEDILVSSYSAGGAGDEEIPTEEFSLNFTKIEFRFFVQTDGQTEEVVFSWDLKQNKK